ncbi:MAG TPA: macro domain-containing protein [Vicinamibacterales bacterium]
MSLSLPPLTVTIVEGDITEQRVDALVNAANNAFWMGSGVAGAIKRRGGAQIERDAMAQGPVDPGEAVMTPAGALPARFVIHAAVMGQDLRTNANLIRRATESALALAAEHALGSIALPALGTGVGGFPIDLCAEVMIGAVRTHAEEGRTSLKDVRFVLYGREAYETFAAAANRQAP